MSLRKYLSCRIACPVNNRFMIVFLSCFHGLLILLCMSSTAKAGCDLAWVVAGVHSEPTTFWTLKTGQIHFITGYIQSSDIKKIADFEASQIKETTRDATNTEDGISYEVKDTYHVIIYNKENQCESDKLDAKIERINTFAIKTWHKHEKFDNQFKSDLEYFVKNLSE